jgi:signal transduction histidine kinase
MKPGHKNIPANRSSLISRLAASTALLAAAVVMLAIFSFQAIRGDVFQGSYESPLKEWSAYIAGRIGENPDIAQAAARNHQMGVVLTMADEVLAFGPDGDPITPQALIDSQSEARKIEVGMGDGTRYTFYIRQEPFAQEDKSLLWLMIGGLLFLVGVVYVVQLSQLRPLRGLKEGVEQVSRGNLSTRVPVMRMDEIGQVGRAFNHMTGRVEQMLNDHDRLMADVSHELRSPMARIKVALELLPQGDKRDSIADDIREMEALTSVLLERERIKNRAAQPDRERFDLAALARKIVDSFAVQVPSVVITDSPQSLEIEADEALLKVLIQNLLDNAVKFSLDDSDRVEVGLGHTENSVTITIDDDGRGIPQEMTERVLEPFVKLDPSRGHRSGYGLGLNLCQRIVEAHHGSIKIQALQPRGTRVRVKLPRETKHVR